MVLLAVLFGVNNLRPTYEYDTKVVEDRIFKEKMDTLGKKGWNVVNACRAKTRYGTGDYNYEIIFKRKIGVHFTFLRD